jgi:hypothetical protein
MTSLHDALNTFLQKKKPTLVQLIQAAEPSEKLALEANLKSLLGLTLEQFEECYAETMAVLGARRYQSPKHYPDMNRWMKVIAESYIRVFGTHFSLMAKDEAFYATTNTIGAIIGSGAPPAIYHLSASLGNALKETDLPSDQLITMKRAVDCGIFSLPNGLLTNPDGEWLECIAFAYTMPTDKTWLHFGDRRCLRAMQCGSSNKPIIILMANTKSAIYGTNICFDSDDTPKLEIAVVEDGLAVYTGDAVRTVKDQDAEASFVYKLRNLALQCLLLMQVQPELLSLGEVLDPSVGAKKRGFATASRSSKPVLSPNWLGKDYASKQVSERQSARLERTRNRDSPRTHWRRGHYRRSLYGPRDAPEPTYRMSWIEPVIVNPGFHR